MATRAPVQPLPSVEPAFDLADLLDESLPSALPAFESAAFDGFPDDFDDFVISPPPSSGGSSARASDTRALRRALALTATRVRFWSVSTFRKYPGQRETSTIATVAGLTNRHEDGRTQDPIDDDQGPR